MREALAALARPNQGARFSRRRSWPALPGAAAQGVVAERTVGPGMRRFGMHVGLRMQPAALAADPFGLVRRVVVAVAVHPVAVNAERDTVPIVRAFEAARVILVAGVAARGDGTQGV